jgi:ribosomal protein S18 acetylase RimI-like enzyme
MNSKQIRKATTADVQAIIEISKQTFIETFGDVNTPANIEKYITANFNESQIETELNNPESLFYLATSGTQIIGYMKLNFGRVQSANHTPQSMEIQRIYVLKKFLGKKIGQVLMNEAIITGQQEGVDSIWLGVWQQNHQAIAFYTKNNFVEFDVHDFILGDETQTDLLMELRIVNIAQYL